MCDCMCLSLRCDAPASPTQHLSACAQLLAAHRAAARLLLAQKAPTCAGAGQRRLSCVLHLHLPTLASVCARSGRPTQKSKRGKVASRPSPKLTLEQLQSEQAAYEEALRQRQQQGAGAASAAAAGDDEEEGAVSYGGAAPGSESRNVEYGSTAAVPEVVTNRMLRRVILFMGAPVFTGILLFPFFYWLKVGGCLGPAQAGAAGHDQAISTTSPSAISI